MMQIVELHFRRRPTCDYATVKKRTQEILGSKVDCPDTAATEKAFLMVRKRHPVKYTDGQVPAQTAILATDQPPKIAKGNPVEINVLIPFLSPSAIPPES